MKYKSIDLFAGIGGIRMGFDRAFGKENIETVFVSEWDTNAQKTYKANFSDAIDIAGDITQIKEESIPEFDICLAGFPCQAFSLAGKRQGFDDDYKGLCRGTLFMDVARICEYHKPKVIFCENVKGLVIHDRGRTFKIICKTFEDLGYKVFSQVLNSKDFGVPQNRERIYIVAFRNDVAPKEFHFPDATDDTKRIRDIIEKDPVPAKYYLSDVYVETLRKHKARHEAKGNGFGYEIREWDGIAGAIVCGGMGRERNLLIDFRQKNLVPTTHIKGEINKEGIRKMTPREWARLQGFPDSYKLPLADVHLYKQFGNSVTVSVIEAIANEIKKVLDKKEENVIMNGNKGEWSELYALIKLLSIGKLYAADENTKRLNDIYFPIIKILRSYDTPFDIEYIIHSDQGVVEISFNKTFEKEISQEKLSRIASYLLSSILNGSNRAFPIEHTDEIMKELLCKRIAAPSSDKTDITLQIHDIHTGYEPICGFSIKSELGSSPTLLNASAATNFIFNIEGISNDLAENINSIESKNKILDRISSILKNGSLKYQHPFNEKFYGNLLLIDANMDKILADILLDSYSNNINDCQELIKRIEERNPMNYPRKGIYEFKFKKFLCSIALGMVPSKEWDGKDEANGGYVIVKKDGDIVAYHIYNRNSFEEYLLKNTKLERGSTSRHGFASIYHGQNNTMNINLNLQIRFI